MRVDHVMNFAWKFHAADGVHLHHRGGSLALSGAHVAGWLWSAESWRCLLRARAFAGDATQVSAAAYRFAE
jgi:hypothetical protein